MSDPSSSSGHLPTTVLGTLRYAQKVHRDIINSSPMEPDYQQKVALGVSLFLRLWSHVVNEGVFRRGESLREMSDTALELITVPFFLGTLCERRQNTAASAQDSRSKNSNDGNNEGQKRGGEGEGDDDIAQRIGRAGSRLQSLLACNDFLFKFLKLCVEINLCSERDVAVKSMASGTMDRATRLEISKRRRELEDEHTRMDQQVRFARERARRNAKVIRADEEAERRKRVESGHCDGADDEDAEDEKQRIREEAGGGAGTGEGAAASLVAPQSLSELVSDEAVEALLEDDDEYQSLKRQALVRFAEYAIYESYNLLQGNSREMEVLGSLSDEEKRRAVEDFQRGLLQGGSGGLSSSSASSGLFNRAQREGAAAAASSSLGGDGRVQPANQNYTVLPGGQVVPFGSTTHVSANRRDEIRAEAFINRNCPTMSLEEFAEQEMAYMKEMQEKEAKGKMELEEENDRLGENGVEERERIKDARFNDWKDANPCVGLTSKGNYA